MTFSERIKLEANKRSHFRCCICYKVFVEVHHIIPESENGPDTLDNAAPLTADCHYLYGGNPELRKKIRQMRDYWWEIVAKAKEETKKYQNFDELIFEENTNYKEMLIDKPIAIYHNIYEPESFEESAKILFNLVKKTQIEFPNKRRVLFLDIERHKDIGEKYDIDIYELQIYFILRFLSNFLSEVHTPLVAFKTKKQSNNIPDDLKIFASKKEAVNFKCKQSDTIDIISFDSKKI
ncbi:TPA: HNH endonuclease [Candidatus Woesearchaeota archaeon]|nr:HNH endonuclease [Candidatus Woesearchaeota archaeon]